MTAAHAVSPSDEGRHPPTDEDLWNESYYCDFVDTAGAGTPGESGPALGGWLRLGLYPNRKVAWWTTWIVRPGLPGVCSVDYHAPVPPGDGLVSASERLGRVEIDLRDPLVAFRLAADAAAELIATPESVYDAAASPGSSATTPGATPTRLGVDLTWTTDGVPYHYDVTTRYEIPCLVSGTVTVGEETYTVRGHGQRDHSWGVRDWWAFGWCWCSLRLDDGTRVHLAHIRVPGFPAFFGYVQTPGAVHPATALDVTEDVGEHGFPTRARIDIEAAPAHSLGIDVTPVAFGPVLLRNEDDGRTSRFPRAMVRCRADDGREGSGWIEWNQPEPATPPDAAH